MLGKLSKEENYEFRFALIIIMFLILTYFSAFIYENFDKTKIATADTSNKNLKPQEQLYPKPSPKYVIEKFVKDIDKYNYEGATEKLLNKEIVENFKGLYMIQVFKIEPVLIENDKHIYSVLVNIRLNYDSGNTNFINGQNEINVSLIRDNNENWVIHDIK